MVPELGSSPANGASGLYGGVLLAGASVAFAALATVTRTITRHIEPVRTAGLGLAASAVALAATVGLGDVRVSSVLAAPGRDLAILVYIGVAATGGAYLAFVLGMHLCSNASAGLAATMIEPGVAVILAALVLQEHLSLREAGGCTLMP